jgi:Domain of unknown function (DUF4397)
MRRTIAAAGTVGLAALIATPLTAHAQQQGDATVSVLHGVPGLTVDVYANGEELIPDFEPGTLTDPLTLPAGSYDLQVFADGDDPESADPAIEANGVEVPAGANATVVAHLDADGNPTLTPYVNDTAPTEAGNARLTVRHTAAAPGVDVRADGDVLFGDLQNPDEASSDVPAGMYSADVTLAGTEDVVLGPADLDLAEGTSTIVYAWGSAEEGNLDLAVQTIDGLHSAPAGVPGGEAGLAPETNGAPAWALGLGMMSALGLAFAGRRLVTARTRA